MTTGPFQRDATHWIIVTGLRPMPVDSSMPAKMSYDAHWTVNNKWSSFDAAMTFKSHSDAEEYMRTNAKLIELPDVHG